MRYSLFEYSRDLRTDYCWKLLPESFPGEFYPLIQKFIFLRDGLRDEESIDWEKIVFFMKIDSTFIACQVVSPGEDYVGRPIYSIRGYSYSGNDNRAIYAVPDLLIDIYKNGFYLDGECLEDGYYIEDNLNPLLPVDEYPLNDELNTDAFKKLITDIRHHEFGYGCVFGPNSEMILHKAQGLTVYGKALFNEYYDPSKHYDVPDSFEAVMNYLTQADVNTHEESMNESMNLLIRFNKESRKQQSYEWILQKPGDNRVLRSSKRFFKGTVSMDRLMLEEMRIRKRYSLLGYKTD